MKYPIFRWASILAGSSLWLTGSIWTRWQGKGRFRPVSEPAPEPAFNSPYQLYFELLPAAVFVYTVQGKLLQVNRAAYALTGFDQPELIALSMRQLVAEEHCQTYEAHLEEAQQGSAKTALAVIGKDRKPVPVEVTTTLCQYEGQQRLLSIFRDISEQVETEAAWRNKQEMEKSITYFATSLYGQDTEEDILWDVAKNCISQLGFEDCVIYLVDEDRDKLVQKAAYGPKNPRDFEIYQPIEIPLGQGIVGSVAASGVAEIVQDTSLDSRYIADDQVRLSEITVPVVYQGKVLGVIDSEHSQKGFFTNGHREILTVIAGLCANKITKARAEQTAMRARIKLIESNKRIAEFKLMALRAQMNPHFVFNCLNAIQFLVATDHKAPAVQYLSVFARLIRQILENSSRGQVKLSHELDLLKNYIQLEQLRLEHPFEFTLSIDPLLSPDRVLIPPMLLYPYVENAILHGLKHQSVPGQLKLTVNQNHHEVIFLIEDNGIGREAAQRLKTSPHRMEDTEYSLRRQALLQETELYQGLVVFTTDLYEDNHPCGTRVTLRIPLESKNSAVPVSPE